MERDRVTRLASDIREADKPIYCSACFNNQDCRHIDFEAACDRGYGNDEAVKIAMDDLVLCEHCLKAGARILGMTDDETLHARLDSLERKLDIEVKRREKAERYSDTLEEAVGQRPEPIHIDHRKRPRKPVEELVA